MGIINNSKLYGLMADETSDNSDVEQLCITVRIVTDDLQADEYVLGLYALDKCDAETIFETMKDALTRFNIPLSKCRAQCYDGARVLTGVLTRFQRIEPRAVLTHCYMHSVNLVVQDTISNVPEIRNFLQFVHELIKFIKDSPKRCQIVREIAVEMECAQTHV